MLPIQTQDSLYSTSHLIWHVNSSYKGTSSGDEDRACTNIWIRHQMRSPPFHPSHALKSHIQWIFEWQHTYACAEICGVNKYKWLNDCKSSYSPSFHFNTVHCSTHLHHRRLKQLARIISYWSSRDLGLNISIFGKIRDLKVSLILEPFMPSFAPSLPPAPTLSIPWTPTSEHPNTNSYADFSCPALVPKKKTPHRRLMHSTVISSQLLTQLHRHIPGQVRVFFLQQLSTQCWQPNLAPAEVDRSDRSGLYSPSRIRVFVKSHHVILLVKGYVFPGL